MVGDFVVVCDFLDMPASDETSLVKHFELSVDLDVHALSVWVGERREGGREQHLPELKVPELKGCDALVLFEEEHANDT